MSEHTSPAAPPRWYERYMLLVATGGNGIFYLQAWKIFSEESAKDVSWPAFAVALWAVSSWFLYGYFKRDWVIIIANIIAVIGASLVLVGIAIHR
ncbi:MAG: hypothetical protein KDB07_01555 [Planctomycetes bacterium]|nr:hypothetical protein [Planctomycetota bacterium]